MDHSLYNPVAIDVMSDESFASKLKSRLESGQRVLFLHSRSAMRNPITAGWLEALLTELPTVSVVTDIMANPTVEQLAIVRSQLPVLPNCVVAMGGGSVIDLAKALIAFAHERPSLSAAELLRLVASKSYSSHAGSRVHFVAIPTTAGTGSDLTRWATLWDGANQAKYSVERQDLYPSEAWIVPGLTASMPADVTVATGLDALSHAVEAYWSTKSNPLVRRLASQAITLIVRHLRRAIDAPDDVQAREGMCLGSVFAGLAFSQTRTAASHALSYPLTARFGIPHGIAVAMSLVGVMRLNWPAIAEAELLLSAFGCRSVDEVAAWLDSVTDGVVSLRLSDYGVTSQDAEHLWDEAGSMRERLGNNPVPVTLRDIQRIFSIGEAGTA